MIMEEKKLCPDCGREMIRGWMRVYAARGGCLYWESEERHPQKSINPFRRGKLVLKKISKLVMSNHTWLDPVEEENSWYCPDCEQVFACFKLEKK